MISGLQLLPDKEFSPEKSIYVVLAFGAFFWALELLLAHSPISKLFLNLLLSNPKLSKAEAEKCVPLVVTRIVGFIHNSVQVPMAIWVVCHPHFSQDRIYGSTLVSQIMLCAAAGFFLHDAISCLLRESPFYVVHGLTCCLGYTAGSFYGFGHYYGGLFLLWEISTPFVQLRWILFKMGVTESIAYQINGLLMVFSFGVVRVLFGTYFTVLLGWDMWREVTTVDKPDDAAPSGLIVGFFAAAAIISTLNYYWFSLMIKSLIKIFVHKETWTNTSHGKNE